MNPLVFRAFLDLLMTSDPTPVPHNQDELLKAWADAEAVRHGHQGWVEAYHRHQKDEDATSIAVVLSSPWTDFKYTVLAHHIATIMRTTIEGKECTMITLYNKEVLYCRERPSQVCEKMGARYIELDDAAM